MKTAMQYKTVGLAVERETHFSSDAIWYRILVNIDGRNLVFTISQDQFIGLHTNGIPAYRNDTTPFEHTVAKY